MARLKVIAVATAGLLLTACGASSGGGNSTSASSSSPSTVLKWAVVTGEPPISFTDASGNPVGMDPDLANAITKQMGVGLQLMPEAFENSLLGLDAGRLDVVSAASVTAEREKKYDMVSYSIGAYGIAVPAASPDVPATGVTDLCGMTLAMNAGDFMVPILKKTSCPSGKSVQVTEFPDATAAQLAVQSGRADAWAGPNITLGYAAKTDSGKWKLTGPEWGQTTLGFVLEKGSANAQAMADAINALIADGTYSKIMSSYGLERAEITKSEVNPQVAGS